MISICVRRLDKRYQSRDGEVVALNGVDLDVREGEFVTIVGPSGCGKSTLLYILGGFIAADGGTAEVGVVAVGGGVGGGGGRVAGWVWAVGKVVFGGLLTVKSYQASSIFFYSL